MNLDLKNDYSKYLLLIAIIFLLRIFILAIYPFHHPSEARYAAISMRMALTENYLMPFYDVATPFFGKPPLAFWASAISFKIFGFSEFSGRLPHLLALMASCFLVWRLFAKDFDKKLGKKNGTIAVLILVSCALFYALNSVMTEAFLLLGMTLITTSFWLQIQSKKPRNFDGYLFFLGCLIAMLSKGPAGIIMPCLPIFIYLVISKRWRELFQKFPIFTGSVAFLAFTLPWFLLAEAKYPGFLEYFFIGENFNRFTKPGWVGDKYGHAHKVAFGTIWPFFFCSILPTSLVAIFKFKKICQSTLIFFKDKNNSTQTQDDQFANSSQFNQNKSGSSLTECNHKFLFFLISLLTPLIFLTFMRNMIGTYGVYALMPFSVISAMIIAQRNWQKFVRFLGYFSIATSLLLIGIFLLKPASLIQKLNYHAYLLSHLPKEASQDKDLKLYYLGDSYANFTINWLAKDRTQNLNKENFLEISNSLPEKKYAIGALFDVLQLPLEYREKMHKIVCIKKRETCLYELNS